MSNPQHISVCSVKINFSSCNRQNYLKYNGSVSGIFFSNSSCSLLLKNLLAGGLQRHKKRLQHSCFPVEFTKFLITPFPIEHPSDSFYTSGCCFYIFCIFLKSTIKQLFRNLAMTY